MKIGSVEIIQSEEQKAKRMRKNEQSLRDLSENITEYAKVRVMGVPKRERERSIKNI